MQLTRHKDDIENRAPAGKIRIIEVPLAGARRLIGDFEPAKAMEKIRCRNGKARQGDPLYDGFDQHGSFCGAETQL